MIKLSKTTQRYLIIGSLVYVFELLVIVVAQAWGANAVAAVGVSFWLGLIVSFGLQKLLSFGDKRMHYKILLSQIIAFSLLVLFNFGFTLLVTYLISPPMTAFFSRTIALAITTVWNFYIYRKFIFKKELV